ncbi:2'-5' RNA ligase [Nocardioides sp. CF8]|uniref:RNA 2',3'-cyclic phosphodiesterase n=1 Tax=Nocardioides sp. CF8 TaxID=110319 RepID=UPI000330B25B|nr:RNA 2',3'-cyclic phosphodiesterase [Nocardioides sp. CF8]EON25724.1 2'-5' RNA ligase [Nocardioides sp. CF8]
MSRLFVAVVPPEEVVEHLDDFLSVRRGAGEFRWTLADQWHVTLAFAAHVPDRAFDELCERLEAGAGRQATYTTKIVGGGAFPHPDGAKVLYAGLDGSFDALARVARNAVSTAGAAVDGHTFHPHVTLARLGRPANVTNWVRLLDAYSGPAWDVEEIALVESHLGEGPRRRPRHEVLATFPLGA